MSVKLKYISKRLLICAVAVELLLILMAGYIWLASLERSAGIFHTGGRSRQSPGLPAGGAALPGDENHL